MKISAAVRWLVTAGMLIMLALVLSSPAIAQEALPEGVTPLPLDHLTGGMPTQAAGWQKAEDALAPYVLRYNSKDREWYETDTETPKSSFEALTYEDPSISVSVKFVTARPAYKPSNIPCAIVQVKVADPSQIRTTMSYENYDKRQYVKAEAMAQHVNAVAAVNGDFFKYHYDVGYVLRQGQFYRDKLNGERDMLIIDDKGDFRALKAAASDDMAACLEEMKQEGRTAVNTFTLGPVLVENGEALDIKETVTAKHGEFQYRYPQQRVAVLQLGELEYAIVETYGKTDSSAGMNLQEFADFIAYHFPQCRLAYNLDGGGSTNVIVNNERIHKTPGARKISDILYFASAYTPTEN